MEMFTNIPHVILYQTLISLDLKPWVKGMMLYSQPGGVEEIIV